MNEVNNMREIGEEQKNKFTKNFWISYWIIVILFPAAILLINLLIPKSATINSEIIMENCCQKALFMSYVISIGPSIALTSLFFLIIGLIAKKHLNEGYWWKLLILMFVGIFYWAVSGWLTMCLC